MTTATAFKKLRAAVRAMPEAARAELARLVDGAIDDAYRAGECAGGSYQSCGDPDCTTDKEHERSEKALFTRLGLAETDRARYQAAVREKKETVHA